MRKIHWTLLGVIVFSAVAVFGLWVDLRDFFQEVTAPATNEPSVQITPVRQPTPTSFLDTTGSHANASRAVAHPADLPRIETLGHAHPVAYDQEPNRTAADEPATLHRAETQPALVGTDEAPSLAEPPEMLPAPYVQTSGHEDGPAPLAEDDLSVGPPNLLATPGEEPQPPLEPNATEAQIMEMMQRLGSAVSKSPLFGDDPASMKQYMREFQQELRKLQQQDAAVPPPPAEEYYGPPHTLVQYEEVPPGSWAQRVETLRSAARQLDEIANQLEQRELFERADQLRGMAQSLRIDARGNGRAK